ATSCARFPGGEYDGATRRNSLWYHPRARRCGPFHAYAEHQATEEARPLRRPRAAREPALPLDREDADEASFCCCDRGRQGEDRGGAHAARLHDRPRRRPWRAAQERSGAQEVAGAAPRELLSRG